MPYIGAIGGKLLIYTLYYRRNLLILSLKFFYFVISTEVERSPHSNNSICKISPTVRQRSRGRNDSGAAYFLRFSIMLSATFLGTSA